MATTDINETVRNSLTAQALTRRRLLGGAAGVIGLGLIAAACGSDDKDSSSPTTQPPASGNTEPTTASTMAETETTSAGGGGDLDVAKLAAGLEVLAVGTYQAALDAATGGDLGEVPDAVAEFVTTALAHHQAHLDAWNTVLTGAGETAVTEPNATLKPTVDEAFGKVTDVGGAAMLALNLEEIAAATYNSAQKILTGKDAIKLAGSIQIIDAQHVAILLYVLGEYPVPETFAGVDKAAAA